MAGGARGLGEQLTGVFGADMRVCKPQHSGARGIPKASTSGAVLRPRRGCGWLQCNRATRRRSEKLSPRRRKPPARLSPSWRSLRADPAVFSRADGSGHPPARPHARALRQTPGPERSWVPLSIGRIRGLARSSRRASPDNRDRLIPEGIDLPVCSSGSTDTKIRTQHISGQKGYSSGIIPVQAHLRAK